MLDALLLENSDPKQFKILQNIKDWKKHEKIIQETIWYTHYSFKSMMLFTIEASCSTAYPFA